MRIREIAELSGYEFCGTDRDIRMLSFADTASEDCLAIVHTRKEALDTRAGAILTEPRFLITEKPVLFVSDSLEIAAVKVAGILAQNGEVKLYGRPVYQNVNGYFIASNVVIGENTIISPGVFLDEDVRIGRRCVIEPNVQIRGGCMIGDDVHILSGSVIGADAACYYHDEGLMTFPGIGRTVLEGGVEIGCNTVIQRGTFSDTVVGKGSKIGNLVDIGHDVRIGSNCKIVSQTGVAGCAIIGDWVEIYGQTGIANHVRIGDRAVVMAQSMVTKYVQAGEKVSGRFARKHSEELRRQVQINKSYEVKKWE